MNLPHAEFLRLDLFPAVVKSEQIEGGVVDRTRAVVTDAHVHILRLEPTGGIELVYSWVLDSFSGTPSNGYTILTDEGHTILIKRSSGCGCGSARLKGARIFDYTVPYHSQR